MGQDFNTPFRQRWQSLAATQEDINHSPMARGRQAIVLREHAEKTHAAYPQYDGCWDGWTLGRMKRTVKFKGGNLHKGDYVLVNPTLERFDGGLAYRQVYSARKAGNSYVYVTDVEGV